MRTEQKQELQPLDKSMMATKLDESGMNEPETWYKVVVKAGAEDVAESLSHSEDELNMSHGISLSILSVDCRSLTRGKTRVHQNYRDHTPFRETPYQNQGTISLPN